LPLLLANAFGILYLFGSLVTAIASKVASLDFCRAFSLCDNPLSVINTCDRTQQLLILETKNHFARELESMKFKILAIMIVLSAMDFAVAHFPALSQTKIEEKVERTEPDFYR
jgi:hypothetical protein